MKASRQRKTKIYAYTICLLAAAIVWVLTMFSGQYSYITSARVKYITADSIILKHSLPEEVKLKVRGQGLDLLSLEIWLTLRPIQVFLTPSALGANLVDQGEYTRYLSAAQLQAFFRKSESNSAYFEMVSPDTLQLVFSLRKFKKVPVKPIAILSYAEGYGLGDEIVAAPDSISVSGSAENLSRLRYVVTKLLYVKNLKKSSNIEMPIQQPSPGIELGQNTAIVSIPVKKLSEGNLTLSLKDYIPGSTFVNPSTVKVFYTVPISKYKLIKDLSFNLSLVPNGNGLAQIIVTSKLPFVKGIHTEPQTVSYYERLSGN